MLECCQLMLPVTGVKVCVMSWCVLDVKAKYLLLLQNISGAKGQGFCVERQSDQTSVTHLLASHRQSFNILVQV